MEFTNYTGEVLDNGNGRSYRVIKLQLGKYSFQLTITKYVGSGDCGTRKA